jgi:hypothetical protein
MLLFFSKKQNQKQKQKQSQTLCQMRGEKQTNECGRSNQSPCHCNMVHSTEGNRSSIFLFTLKLSVSLAYSITQNKEREEKEESLTQTPEKKPP